MNDNWADENIQSDPSWAEDVSYRSLEKAMDEKINSTKESFKSLEELTKASKSNKDKKEKRSVSPAVRQSKKKFTVFMIIWSCALSFVIAFALFKFYKYLEDYEKVYQESLPYHNMDELINHFEDKDAPSLYSLMTTKPEPTEFETYENVIGYIQKMIDNKSFTYTEAEDSTDKMPVYYISADDYIIARATLLPGDVLRAHGLPIYSLNTLEIYTDASFSFFIEAPETATVYVNDVAVTDSFVYHVSEPENAEYFKDFATIPGKKAYRITGLFENPDLKIVTSFNEEIIPEFDSSRGLYTVGFTAPTDTENEMKDFAKEAVDAYTRVVCREVNASELDKYFTEGNEIVKSIKSNDSNFKYFPNHKTTSTESIIKDFIPYSDEAFYCEIEHTQHMLKYGSVPIDYTTDARFFYVMENGEWKVCNIQY